jgi:hypothetical protein
MHKHIEESFDEALIKTRRKNELEIESSSAALNSGKPIWLPIPAPKIWRRSSKQPTCSFQDAAKMRPAHAQECTAPIDEIAVSKIDAWTRDFLMLVAE